MVEKDPSRISPTAHYTSYVWFRNGMSHPVLATAMGRAFYYSMQPFNALAAATAGGVTLERFLLQRHRIIDYILTNAIESEKVGQVLEVAAGLSPRGFRMADKYRARGLKYVEADLPDMAARKRRLLTQGEILRENHEITTVNVLEETGPTSIAAVAAEHLDPTVGTAIITEGLVNYFDRDVTAQIWSSFADVIAGFGGGVYLADIGLQSDWPDALIPRIFRTGLHRFTRGNVELRYFDGPDETADALRRGGFSTVEVHQPHSFSDRLDIPEIRRGDVIRIIEAWV